MKSKQILAKVQLRGGFSDRNNISSVSTLIQYENFDERTRTILYNKFHQLLNAIDWATNHISHRLRHTWEELYRDVLENVYCIDMVSLNDPGRAFYGYTESTIKNDTYDAVLTVIEYVFNWTSQNFTTRRPLTNYNEFIQDTEESGHYNQITINEYDFLNAVFEQECIGYRFVGQKIVKITDPTEISEIEAATTCIFEGCRTHIANALGFLSDRDKKDYKNCIKESISAVESICKVVTQNEHATLGDALKELERKRGLKGPLKSAFEKLYNYTNDKGGIRHADGLFTSEVTFEEAKFMLVSCSAFVNYLIAEYGKIQVK